MPRRIYLRFKPGGWLVFMRQRMALWSGLHQVAERGLGLLEGCDPGLRERLQEAHDMFSMIEEHFPGLLDRFEREYLGETG